MAGPDLSRRLRAVALVASLLVIGCEQSAVAPPGIVSPTAPSAAPASDPGGGSPQPSATDGAAQAHPVQSVQPKAVIDSGLDVTDVAAFASMVAAGGYVWLGSRQGLFRIDPESNEIEQIDDRPGVWIASDGSGVIRIAYGDNTLRRYDATTGALQQTVDVPRPGGLLVEIGRVWVSEHGQGGLRQYDAADLTLRGRTQLAPSLGECCGPGTIRALHGSLWIADPGHESIIEVDPTTADVVQTIRLDVSPSDGLTVADGVLWTRPIPLEDPPAPVPDGILRLDPATATVEVVDLPAPITTDGLITEVQGHPWIGAAGRQLEIDATGRILREVTFDTGEPFTGSAYEAFGDVWLISEGDPRIVRLPAEPFRPRPE